MAEEPENHTLRLLREMREEMKEIRVQTNLIPKLAGDVAGLGSDVSELRFDVSELRSGVSELRSDVSELQIAVAAMRADQTRANELLETVTETQKNQGMRLNAIDGRLALIEKHSGLVKA
jgi:outer membrane murein-binding lipoprotein Lpp